MGQLVGGLAIGAQMDPVSGMALRQASRPLSRGANCVQNAMSRLRAARSRPRASTLMSCDVARQQYYQLPEAEQVKWLQEDPVFSRPKGVPSDWIAKPAKLKVGIRYIHPGDSRTSVRISAANPNSGHACQRVHNVKVQIKSHMLDKFGQPVLSKYEPAYHIPLEDFDFTAITEGFGR